jgi:hypothetical protein
LRIFKDNQTGNKSFRTEINQPRLKHNRRGNELFTRWVPYALRAWSRAQSLPNGTCEALAPGLS